MKLNSMWVAAGLVVFTAFGCKEPDPPEQKIPVAAKVKAFTVDKAEVDAGETVTLSWEVEDATGIAITTQTGAPVQVADATAASGSVQAQIERNTVFLLTANGEGGSESAVVSVTLRTETVSSLVFTAVPQKIAAGQSATLFWNAPGAEQVTVTNSAGDTVYSGDQSAGSVQVRPNATETYSIDAGGKTAQVQIQVGAGILGFASSAPAVSPGDPVTLSWKVAGAESVTLSVEGRGELITVTDAAEVADGSFEDTVPATLQANGLVTYTLTAKTAASELTEKLTVYVGSEPVISSFTAPRFAKVGSAYVVSWKTMLATELALLVDGKLVHVATSPAEVATGNFSITTPMADQTVELRASNTRGGVASKSATVSPVDTTAFVSFGAMPAIAANGGDPVSLSWQVTNARRVRISVKNGPLVFEQSGQTLDNGTVYVYPNGPTEYLLDADNMVGDAIAQQSVTADVTTPAKLVFTPSPAPLGSQIELTGTTVTNGGALMAPEIVSKNVPGDTFVDISKTGNKLPVPVDDDTGAYVAQLTRPFQTSIAGYPVNATGISVSVNGWMIFSPNVVPGPTSPPALPNAVYEPLAIIPFGKNMIADESTRIYWKDEGEGANRRVIVQWEDIRNWINANIRASFQVQVYPDGQVVFAYRNVTGWSVSDTVVVGIVNGNKTRAFKPVASQLTNNKPASGDTFRFFSELKLPYAMTASSTPMYVIQTVGQGTVEIVDAPAIATGP